MTRVPLSLFGIFTLSILAVPVRAQIDVTTVGLTGDPPPGLDESAFFQFGAGFFSWPSIDDSGRIVFHAQTSLGRGVWAGPNGNIQLMAHNTEEPPGTGEGVTFDQFDLWGINESGETIIAASIEGTGVDNTNEDGIWIGPPGDLQLFLRTGDPVPDMEEGTVFTGFTTTSIVHPTDASPILFHGTMEGPSVTPQTGIGVWSGAVNGPLQLVFQPGMEAPGFGEGITISLAQGTPVMNRSGQIAFGGRTTQAHPSWGLVSAIWVGMPGAFTPVMQVGEPAPGIPDGEIYALGNHVIDDSGRVTAIGMGYSDGSEFGIGIWNGVPGSVELVAHTGSTAPNAPGADERFTAFGPFYTLAAESGQIAFHGVLETPGLTGLWAGDPDALELVALQGSQAPDLPEGVVFETIQVAHLNNEGSIVFRATVEGAGVTEDNDAGYWGGPINDLRLILRKGDELEVAPGVFRTIERLYSLQPTFWSTSKGRNSLNDAGQFVFQVEFTDSADISGGTFITSLGSGPELTFQRIGNELELSWSEEGLTLETADSVSGPWNNAPSQANPQTVTIEPGEQYFQLRQ